MIKCEENQKSVLRVYSYIVSQPYCHFHAYLHMQIYTTGESHIMWGNDPLGRNMSSPELSYNTLYLMRGNNVCRYNDSG